MSDASRWVIEGNGRVRWVLQDSVLLLLTDAVYSDEITMSCLLQ